MEQKVELKRRRLGRTDLWVTELGLGGYMFTGEFGVARQEALAIQEYALAAGINYIDTAAMYGFGEGEELLGRTLAKYPTETVYISTKVGYLDSRTITRNLGEAAYHDEAAIYRAIEHSLWLLRRDYVDILMVHEPNMAYWWPANQPITEAPVLHVLEDLKRQGVIGAIGLGGWDCDNIADLLETGRFDVALVAGGYTLIQQKVRERVIPAAKKHDVGLVMGGTFLQGLLATIQRERMEDILRGGKYDGWLTEEWVRRLLTVYDLCDEAGMAVTEMAIRYILADPDIHTMIPGAQQVAHLKANLAAAAKGPLPDDLIAQINDLTRR